MKKLFTTFCIALLVPALAACGTDKEATYNISEPGSWKDGVYTQVAEGHKGNVPVTVTIEGGKMTNIEVGKNEETPDRGGKAIEKLPKAMLKAQSYDVDAISGATRTSKALKEGVALALEQASTTEN